MYLAIVLISKFKKRTRF